MSEFVHSTFMIDIKDIDFFISGSQSKLENAPFINNKNICAACTLKLQLKKAWSLCRFSIHYMLTLGSITSKWGRERGQEFIVVICTAQNWIQKATSDLIPTFHTLSYTCIFASFSYQKISHLSKSVIIYWWHVLDRIWISVKFMYC